MNEIFEGCYWSKNAIAFNYLCAIIVDDKKHDNCPCSICLVKAMCRTTCKHHAAFIDEYKLNFRKENGT